MKRKFALVASVMAALLIVGTVLVLTSRPTQAAASVDAPARAVSASTLLWADNFDYGIATGNLTVTSGGNWVNHSGAAPYVGYTTTSLSMTGYGSSGVGGAATILTNGAEDVNRTFITQTTGTVYFAALVNASTAGGGAYFLHLKDSGSNFRARVFGRNDAGVLRFGLDVTGTGVYATAAYSYNVTYLLATKYSLDTGATALYVLDSFNASEPATPVVSFTTGTTVTVRAVAIRQSAGGPSAIIDGIRVANTWEDVVGVVAPATVADLGVSKDGPATALAGDTITYTINLSNTGTYTATGTVITDTLPAEVSYVTYTTALSVNNFTQNGQNLIWDVGDVPTTTVNATIEVQAVVSNTLLNGASFTNTVKATTTYTETNLANNADSVTTFIGAPDLAIVKTGPANVNAGDTFTYTLAYSNAGTINATGVKIIDQLPAGVAFVTETTGSAVVANGQITWTLGTLNTGVGSSIDVVVTAVKAGDWVNTATISGSPVDSDPLDNTSSVTTTVNGVDVYVRKSGPAVAFGGELISYTITYGNSGNVTATATLTDQLPISFTLADIAVDGSGLPFANGVWTAANLAPNTEVSFTFALTVPTTIANSTRITNALTISAIESGDDPIDNAASASSTVYQIVPIAAARAGAVGQVFGIEGQVIYVPNTFGTNEWGVQDASGGISVFFSPPPSAQLGDRVRLVATRGAFSGQAQLGATVYYFANLGPGTQVAPRPYTTGQVLSGSTEGWLVVVTGTVSSLPACSTTANYQFNLNDGSGATTIFVDKDTLVNVCAQGVVNGDRIVVTGFSTQFSGLFEVKPRFPADVKRLFDVTFVYNDLEDVVHVGENVQLRGDFTNWGTNPITLSHDAGYMVFSATVTLPTTATQGYKYYADAFEGNNLAWDLLNTDNRSFAPTQGVTVKQDYRNTPIGWGNLNGPATATINLGASVVVSGEVYVQSVTAGAGAGRGVKAEVGYGAAANPASWTWTPLAYVSDAGSNNDVYAGSITPIAGGVYSYALRYDANFGAGNPNAGWTYADLNGVPFTLDQAGVLTVTAPQLAINKGIEKPRAEMELGDVVTYTIELSNSGDAVASGVLITDVLPAEITFGGFVTANGAQYGGGTITWSGSINAGVTATVIFTATVGNQRAFYGRTVTNTAQFTSSNGGSDTAEAAFQIVKRYFLFAPLIRR